VANLLTLVGATTILVMIPGPNVALIVANSIHYGFRTGSVTVLGTTFGVAIQLAAVVLGMAAIIEFAADAMTWIRWAGVMYLVWFGSCTWNEPAKDLRSVTAVPAVFWRGCMLAAINPKTLMFNAAFLPQFVSADGNTAGQLSLVAAIFLAVLLIGDMLWALTAGAARPLLDRCAGVRNRLTGGFLVAAGVGLALSRRSIFDWHL
jgi:threonine/homoserine/homoserine lactone efflux protein